jgi:hypothetical protein
VKALFVLLLNPRPKAVGQSVNGLKCLTHSRSLGGGGHRDTMQTNSLDSAVARALDHFVVKDI